MFHSLDGDSEAPASKTNELVEPSAAIDEDPDADPESVLRFGWSEYFRRCFYFLFWHKLQVLQIFVPIAIICGVSNADPGVVFAMCMLGLIPLASMLGDITEQLALHTNETVGGLLNATFGNATEAIVSMFAIRSGQIRLVQISLVGSVISNLLLVLGSAFIAGGFKYKEQLINITVAVTNTGLLFFVSVCLFLVTLMRMGNLFDAGNFASELKLSRFISVLMLAGYGLYLWFQLKTHVHLFNDDEESGDSGIATQDELNQPLSSGAMDSTMEQGDNFDEGAIEMEVIQMSTDSNVEPTTEATELTEEAEQENQGGDDDEDDDDDEEKILGPWGGIIAMVIATIFISILSQLIVDAVEGAAASLNIPSNFIGTILLPIVGNAAEHASALTVAYKGKINLAIGVAVGSAIQIGLFVAPFMTIIAALAGQPMSLDFGLLEMGSVFASVVLVGFLISDGKANWLKGALLVFLYFIIAGALFYRKEDA